ncbi:hypothetical protein [Variovorax sp. E3]|uniref:hypothetical protein n=1 Tax=Variovorax sp. E3 TaxID=1914993 RepID=UPI0022B718C4|nr:hypothetical protein [Variovorax sp. E3]
MINTNAAAYANGKGGILSADTLRIATGATDGSYGRVDNSAGFIGSKNALSANTGEFINGNSGTVLGQSTVSMATQGAAYDNSGGQTLAVGNLQIDSGSGEVKNVDGLIRSGAMTTVRAAVSTTPPPPEPTEASKARTLP